MPLAPPRIGEVRDGYRFVGGNAGAETSWVEANGPLASVNWTAPGASYLPRRTAKTNPSTEAGFEKWKAVDNPATAAARASRSEMLRAEGLLTKQRQQGQDTGTWVNNTPILKDINGWIDPEVRELDAIQARAARANRTPGEGAISDFDAQQFLNMTYGKDKPVSVNKAIIRAQRLRADNQLQHRAFQEWYKGTFGNTNGASEAWDRYAQDNTIFDPASEAAGVPAINTGRKAWRDYFGVARTEADKRQGADFEDIRRNATPSAPSRRPDQASLDGYMKLAKQGVITGKGQRGAPGNPYRATSEAVLNRLPKGSYVIGPDGRYGVID